MLVGQVGSEAGSWEVRSSTEGVHGEVQARVTFIWVSLPGAARADGAPAPLTLPGRGVTALLDAAAGPEAEAVDARAGWKVALTGVGADGAWRYSQEGAGLLIVEQVLGMRFCGKLRDRTAAEVSLGLGLVVDQDAAVEEGWDVLAEIGCCLAAPGSNGDSGLLGDVPFVDHGAAVWDHGVSWAVRCRVPCTLVSASLRRRQSVVVMLVRAGGVPGRS
ncbi:hypothetical protein [Streptomyces sp. NRRL F-5065]|uniref:hypothetical protein n=1 Tax=Streptomyces sp. NRRL F-5065 TaxID=1463855 RepID=UPI000568AD7F|nr:hypothetical protein [Streptomyces sp. NRRL F-5065]